jgi:hypothetical protein
LGRIVWRVFDNVGEALVFVERRVDALFYGSAFWIPPPFQAFDVVL